MFRVWDDACGRDDFRVQDQAGERGFCTGRVSPKGSVGFGKGLRMVARVWGIDRVWDHALVTTPGWRVGAERVVSVQIGFFGRKFLGILLVFFLEISWIIRLRSIF